MPVDATALGVKLPSRVVEVTPRMTLAYAAGIGDLGPATFDDCRAEPLLAPPSFSSVLEWPVVANGRSELLGLEPDEAQRSVHAEQDSFFLQEIRVGDRVRTRGRIVAIRQTRAGALVQTRLSTEDAADETPKITSWHTAIFRGIPVAGEGGRLEEAPSWPSAGPALERSAALPIPRQAAHVYTEYTGIWNPIHTERRVALAAGLPDIILHGTATLALAGREIVACAKGKAARLLRLRGRFRAVVVPGSTITVLHGAASDEAVHFIVRTEAGEEAIGDGFVQLAPSQPEGGS